MREDPGQEFERLSAAYQRMFEGELEKLACESGELTAIAREALKAEFGRRGMTVPDALINPIFPEGKSVEAEFDEFVAVRSFRDLQEALLAKGSVESAGIECFLRDENMVRLDWFISNMIGGVRLMVRPGDAEAALEILDEPLPENFEVEGLGEFKQSGCPKCGSIDINYGEVSRKVGLASAWVLGFPLPLGGNTWKCHSCNALWKDTDEN
jgi:hypothetical protein